MEDIAYEDLFNRIFHYLRLSGVSLTRESTLTTLQLIEELLATESSDVLDRVIAELPRRLSVSEISLPLLCPRVNRSSIGYRDK